MGVMPRLFLVGSILSGTCLGGFQDSPKAEPPSLKKIPAPNSGRSANPGDEAEIYGVETPAGISMRTLEGLQKSTTANDRVGIDEYKKKNAGYILPVGTRILVVKLHLSPFSMAPISSERFASDLQAGVGKAPALEAIEVRVVDGPLKDKLLFVPVDSVAVLKFPGPDRFAEEQKRREEKSNAQEEARAKLNTPASRAARLLATAKNLEKSGKPKPALENYRKIVAEFGETASAKEAKERIKALEGK